MMMRFHTLLFIVWVVIPLVAACAPAAAAETPEATAQPTSTVAYVDSPLLYRGDAGRRCVYDASAIRVSPKVLWQKSFDEDAYFPTYADGLLYIGTSSGKLLALDSLTGEERWSFDAQQGPILVVALTDAAIYFGAGENGFYSVDIHTGKQNWMFETDGSVWSSSPLIMDGVAYFGSDTGTVYALDLMSHDVLWTFKASSGVLSQLAGDGEHVYVPTRSFLYAIDVQDGSESWRLPTRDKWNSPAVANGIVYAGNGNAQFVALDAATGKQRWVYTAPMGNWSEWSAPVVTADAVYVGHSNNTMYALDVNTGQERWHFQTDDWATTDPILADGVLYFGVGAHANLAESSAERPFYALDASTGEELWSFTANGLIYSAATIGEGTIYFKTLNNTLYALQ